MKKLLLSALLTAVCLTASADYTVSFTTGSGAGNTPSGSAAASTFVSQGADNIASWASSGTFTTKGSDGIALGSKNANSSGTLTLTLSDAGKVAATKIVFTTSKYNNLDGKFGVAVNGTDCTLDTDELGTQTVIFREATTLNTITFKGNNYRIFVGGFTVFTSTGGSGEDPEPVKELGNVVATYNNGMAIESEGQITIEQGQTIEISADNAAKISAQIGEGLATEVEASTMTWTPNEIVSDEVATIIATAADGTTTKKLEFFITITEKTAVDPDEPAGNPTYTKADWANLDMTAEYIVTATGVDKATGRVATEYVMTSTVSGNGLTAATGIVLSDDKTSITTLPDGSGILSFEATSTEGEYLVKFDGNYLKAGEKKLSTTADKSEATVAKIDGKIQFPSVVDSSNRVGSLQQFSQKNSNPIFNCYCTSQKPITLYKVTKSGTSSISEVTVEKSGNGMMFDLQGRRVVAPRKGQILIQNGRKVRF